MLTVVSYKHNFLFDNQNIKGKENRKFFHLSRFMQNNQNVLLVITNATGNNKNFNLTHALQYIRKISHEYDFLYFIIEDSFDIDLHSSTMSIDASFEAKLFNKIKAAVSDFIVGNKIKFFHWYKSHSFEYFDLPNLDFIKNTPTDQKFDTKIVNKISCLNNRSTLSRAVISSLIHDLHVNLTYNEPLRLTMHSKEFIDYAKDISICNDKIVENFSLLKSKYKNQKFIKKKHNLHYVIESLTMIKKAFVNLVTESPFFYPYPRFSEKTLKPIFVNRPFILLSPPNSLNFLKENGFLSFSKWWDESYDTETNHWRRPEKVYQLAEKMNSYSLDDCRQLLQDMKPVLNHNKHHIQKYSQSMISKLNPK